MRTNDRQPTQFSLMQQSVIVSHSKTVGHSTAVPRPRGVPRRRSETVRAVRERHAQDTALIMDHRSSLELDAEKGSRNAQYHHHVAHSAELDCRL